ncbi:hypothetical protein NE865_16553 [Phthorimaea operculella]|nr:hypothetical protein NE865_16553 [Phthorimaea operculella]
MAADEPQRKEMRPTAAPATKKPEHLITYKCAGKASQIDYIIADNAVKQKFKDCKVIPGEALTSQHRILVAVYDLPKPIKTTVDRTPRIKWKELDNSKGEHLLGELKTYLETDLNEEYNSAEEIWTKFEHTCKNKAKSILGVSKGGLSTGKDPSWWSNDIKDTLANKKTLFKKWQSSQRVEDEDDYKEAKKHAKRCVAQERGKASESFYEKLENAKTENEVLKVAKQRHRATIDIKLNKYIKDKDQNLLTDSTKIKNRWSEYYGELLNEEFPTKSQHQ